MSVRSGGQLLVECLKAQGVNTVFGVPGESYLPVLDGLYAARSEIRTIMCRNEGGASFMATAWGKYTGEPGICLVTRGPGATNAAIGVHTARQDSTPMLLLVGQVSRDARGREAFQEIDYERFYGDAAKWAVEINAPDRIPELLGRAFATARNGRPGPVVVALPEDVLSGSTGAQPTGYMRYTEAGVSAGTIGKVLAGLARAKRPLVMVGGGGWRASGRRDLKTFVERHQLPAIVSFRCQDLLDNHSPGYAGDAGVGMSAGVKGLINRADLILGIGLEFSETATDGYTVPDLPAPRQTLIHAHACPDELGKVYQPAMAINSGPNQFCAALAGADELADIPWRGWTASARAAYLESLDCPAQPGAVDMARVCAWLRERLPPDVVITNGAGNFALWPNKFLTYGARARLIAPQSGAMGYGVPAAIAVKIADPERTVVCFSGDGDFQMNGQELATSMQHRAQPIILLLNNRMYGTIRMHQERHYPGHVHGTDIENPKFDLLAAASGYHYERVEATGQFPQAFARGAASATGALIELIIDPEAISPRQTLSGIRAAASTQDP